MKISQAGTPVRELRANLGVKIGGFCSLFLLLKGIRGVLIPQMSTGRAPVVLVGNSAAYWYMGYSQLPLGGKPLGASKVLRFPGPETTRIVVAIRQMSSRTPFILSEVMTDVARGKVPLRLTGLYALCEFKQPRGGPFLNSLKLPPTEIGCVTPGVTSGPFSDRHNPGRPGGTSIRVAHGS